MAINCAPPRINAISLSRGAAPAKSRTRGRALSHIRQRILWRDGHRCKKCGIISAADLEIDHIVPLHLGGAESDANRQTLCKPCHQAKSLEERSVCMSYHRQT